MKKITETAKELGITFCQDCAQYSWEHCDKFGDYVDPGELSCPHFLAATQFTKLKRDIENAAATNGFVVKYEDECDEALNITFIKVRKQE